jgi:hypothetical protein
MTDPESAGRTTYFLVVARLMRVHLLVEDGQRIQRTL